MTPEFAGVAISPRYSSLCAVSLVPGYCQIPPTDKWAEVRTVCNRGVLTLARVIAPSYWVVGPLEASSGIHPLREDATVILGGARLRKALGALREGGPRMGGADSLKRNRESCPSDSALRSYSISTRC